MDVCIFNDAQLQIKIQMQTQTFNAYVFNHFFVVIVILISSHYDLLINTGNYAVSLSLYLYTILDSIYHLYLGGKTAKNYLFYRYQFCFAEKNQSTIKMTTISIAQHQCAHAFTLTSIVTEFLCTLFIYTKFLFVIQMIDKMFTLDRTQS